MNEHCASYHAGTQRNPVPLGVVPCPGRTDRDAATGRSGACAFVGKSRCAAYFHVCDAFASAHHPLTSPFARGGYSHYRIRTVSSPPFMRLAQHLTALSRFVQAMRVWSVKTRRSPCRHCRDARVYGHTTTAMIDMSTPPRAERIVLGRLSWSLLPRVFVVLSLS